MNGTVDLSVGGVGGGNDGMGCSRNGLSPMRIFFFVVFFLFVVAAQDIHAQERVIKDEPAPKVYREGQSEPIADGHDLPEMEVDRWGSAETWELALGLCAVGTLLVVAFLRWQARAIRRG